MPNNEIDGDGVLLVDREFGSFDIDFESRLIPEEKSFDERIHVEESAPAVEIPLPEDNEEESLLVTPLDKRVRRALTRSEKAIRVMMRRSEQDEVPVCEHLLRGKQGERVKIKDVALFIGDPGDELVEELAVKCPIRNTVNCSEVQRSRIIEVGSQVLRHGRMYQPIQVARIEDHSEADPELQCVSGRVRLALLSLLYGEDTEITVYVEDMTLSEARDAVVVANQGRPAKAAERAEHAVIEAVRGNVEAHQDQIYANTAKTKAKAKKYCVYSVLERGHPVGLSFKVSQTASRRDGGLTTISNVECFWGMAVEWSRGMSRKQYDEGLRDSTMFLNALSLAMKGIEGFDPREHMGATCLSALGKYFRTYRVMAGNPISVVTRLARVVVGLPPFERKSSDEIYKLISQEMRG